MDVPVAQLEALHVYQQKQQLAAFHMSQEVVAKAAVYMGTLY